MVGWEKFTKNGGYESGENDYFEQDDYCQAGSTDSEFELLDDPSIERPTRLQLSLTHFFSDFEGKIGVIFIDGKIVSPGERERLSPGPRGVRTYVDHFLQGGYPEPVFHEDPSFHSIWMEQYHRRYIEPDIRRLFPRLDIIRYRRFTGMLSSSNGTVINRSELGRSLDISEVTIKNYLDIAEGTFLWRNIFSYEKSVSRSVVKRPRGHFRDSGLSLWLQRIKKVSQLMEYPGVGSSFEAFVTEELIKGFSAAALSSPVYYYYRTKNGAEVDLIVCGDFGILPIEIKFGTQVKPGTMRWLKDFLEKNNFPLGLIINNPAERALRRRAFLF